MRHVREGSAAVGGGGGVQKCVARMSRRAGGFCGSGACETGGGMGSASARGLGEAGQRPRAIGEGLWRHGYEMGGRDGMREDERWRPVTCLLGRGEVACLVGGGGWREPGKWLWRGGGARR